MSLSCLFFFPQQNATVFSSVSTVPRLLHFTQGGLAVILRFRAKSEGLGDFNLLNIKRQLLGRAPGNPLAHFRSCRQLLGHCYYILVLDPLSLTSILLLRPSVDNSI